MNFSSNEIQQMNILLAHEYILHSEHDRIRDEMTRLAIAGADVKNNDFYRKFFDEYERHFSVEEEPSEPVKLVPKPILKG